MTHESWTSSGSQAQELDVDRLMKAWRCACVTIPLGISLIILVTSKIK